MTESKKAAPPKSPGVHFPPPFLYVALFLLGLLMNQLVPLPPLPRTPSRVLSALLLAPGLGLTLWSLWLFLRARTSPLPMRPATTLVRSGPYRWTRNPMYLGMLLLYLGVGLLFDVTWALLLAPVLVFLVGRLIIRREERYLEAKFGEDYRRYMGEVRRWV